MTTENKHTPGPWVRYADSGRIYEGVRGGMLICEVRRISGFDANAHLIAAAPDLLEALELAIYDAEGSYDGGDLSFDWLRKARAAIAKARGQ